MGLIEKRLIKLGREEWVPEANTELREVTGGAQTYEVDWTTFETDEAALNNVRNQCLRRVTAAFRVICCDELGKEAVAEKIQKVAVRNVAKAEEKGIQLADGVLTVQCALSKGDAGYFSDNEIIRVVERMI